jgi:branched-chain amino acid transport system substrate-binding protein
LIEQDKAFVKLGSMGSPTVLAAQGTTLDAGVLQLFPLTAAELTFKFDPAKPDVESTRAAVKYMIESQGFKKPCSLHQDDEYGKKVRRLHAS